MRSALRIPSFRRLYTALTLSSFGDWLGFLATTALAAQLVDGFQDKAFATGGVLAFRMLPAVLFGPIAGAVVDRFDRRKTMVVCDFIRFGLLASIPLSGSLVYLFIASFLIETASLFWIPAKEASVPNLVPRVQLEAANQLSLFATYATAPIAAAVFALLSLLNRALASGIGFFSTNPVDLALYFDAATFLFSALTVARLKEIPAGRSIARDTDDAPPGFLTSIREGYSFVRSTPLVRGLIVGMLGALAAGGAIIATGRLFAQVLGGGDAAYGLLFGSIFVGLALGIGVGPRMFGTLSRRRLFGLSLMAAGACLAAMAVVPALFVATVFTILVGLFAGVAYVVGLTLLQAEVSDELRGRTFALVQSLMRIDLLVVTATTPFIVGAIGRHTIDLPGSLSITLNGVSITLLVGGILGFAVGVLSYRQMDDRPGVPLRNDLVNLIRRRADRDPYPGFFVAFEGGEGAGKSTQSRLLADWLTGRVEVVVTREPGGTPLGRAIRSLLLNEADDHPSPRAEALLYAADRAHHVARVIQPALDAGAVVITDRYLDSSLAYQGAGRELDPGQVRRMSEWATGGLVPDLTVLLDLDPEVGLTRLTGDADRIESETLEFHRRVRAEFLALAERDPDRYLVVEATLPTAEVQRQIRQKVERMAPHLVATTPTVPLGGWAS